MSRSTARDMTQGSPIKNILIFSIPLIMGTLFQQLYSMTDSVIVAKFLGETAFAGVGCTGSMFSTVIGFANGMCSGVAIPAAQDFGAGDYDGVKRCAANAIYIIAGIGLIVTLVMTVFIDDILRFMNTTPETYEYAKDYFFSMCVGIVATLMYNLVAGFLRALGDSKTPLVFLVICSVLNVVLDLLFIAVFDMGVSGAGYATVLSQAISFILCVIFIAFRFPLLHIRLSDFRPDRRMIRRMVAVGAPMGLQHTIISIGGLLLQRAVNTLGTTYVTAMSAANKTQNLIDAPTSAIGIAVANYAGQNYGARRADRIKKGVRDIAFVMLGYSLFACAFNWTLGRSLAQIFIDASSVDVLDAVQRYIRINCLFVPSLAMIFIYRSALTGTGYSQLTLIASVAEIISRGVIVVALIHAFGFMGACFSNPITWTLAAGINMLLYFMKIRDVERKLKSV